MANDNIINIYWGSERHGQIDQNVLHKPLRSLFSINRERKNPESGAGNFLRCPAVTDLTTNTYVIPAPMDTGVTLAEPSVDGEEGGLETYGMTWQKPHRPTLIDNDIVLMQYGMLFFADQPVEMLYAAPWFSKTPHSQYGALVPAKFNIGEWFRPAHLEFNLWEGVKEFHLKEDEAMAYVTFLTDKRVVLHRFFVDSELQRMASTFARANKWEPKVPLAKRYKRFKESQTREIILKQIVANVVE